MCRSTARERLGSFDCSMHPLFTEALPRTMTWLRCTGCGHVHTDGYWSAQGLAIVLARPHSHLELGIDMDRKRSLWAPAVQAVIAQLADRAMAFENKLSWMDVGFGDGALVMTAAEFGFDAFGVDARRDAVDGLLARGYKAVLADFTQMEMPGQVDVMSFADVLEHLPFPVLAIRKAHAMLKTGGILYVSSPNSDCASWREMDSAGSNPYWIELEHYHNFSRSLLMKLLHDFGLRPVYYGVSARYKAGMEVIACKAPSG